jgi:uncharacterized repeat protein (TIGR01451 family)
VTGIAAGDQNNITGNVTSTEGGTGLNATALLKVVAPPSISKAFGSPAIGLNATTSLQFTITNPPANTVTLTGVGFTDNLPVGLTVASATTAVCGGTLAVTAPTTIVLSGASIAAGSQCQFSVTVTGAQSGQYTNTTGTVTSTNGGTGNNASASLTVASPPTIQKAFGGLTVPLTGTTSLTFTVANPNSALALHGLAFTDNLPAGLVVAPVPNLTNTCGGTATANAGAGVVSLSGGTVASSASCTVSVTIQGTTAGAKNNSVSISSTEGGAGNVSNASITVVSPANLSKSFGSASIPLNGSTSLTFTVQNNNATTALTGVGFTDTLPAGMVVSSPSGLSGSCGGGSITAAAGSNSISLSGASLVQGGSCTFAVNVTGTSAGTLTNTTAAVTSNEGGSGAAATAAVLVVAPPSIAKAFGAASIGVGANTSLTFTVANPPANAVALTGVAFTDALPAGLSVANTTVSMCGGTLNITGGNLIALSGATIAAGAQCQFPVTVTATTGGVYNNVTSNVTSTNGGVGNVATATMSSVSSLGGSIGLRSGPINARVWPIVIGNGGPAPAIGAAVTSFVLTQTLGAACTPVVTSAIPAVAGDIASGSTGTANVVIDFSSCSGTVFFKLTAGLSANGGAATGTLVRLNQVP